MKNSILSPLALLTGMLAGVNAAGYNESTPAYFGVEQFNTYEPISLAYGPLNLTGFLFGNTGTSVTFASWAARATCNSGYGSGYDCVNAAIQNATYLAASGVVQDAGNYMNTMLLAPANAGQAGYYSTSDIGQGPSCSSSTDDSYPPQTSNCTGSLAGTGAPAARFTFPTRGIKVTCKNACGAKVAINEDNWNGLLTQLTQAMSDNNYFAARFVVLRTASTPYIATVRCRVTVPNVSEYPMSACPDSLPAFGAGITAADLSPQ